MNASIAILFLALLQKSIGVYQPQGLSVNEVAPLHRYLKRDAPSSGPPTQQEEENDFENGLIDANSEDFSALTPAEKAFSINNPVCGLCSSECALYCNERHFNTFFVECCFKETETFARYLDVVSPAKRRDPFMDKFERFDEPLVLPVRTAPVTAPLRSLHSPWGGTDDMMRMGKRSFYRPSQIFHQKRVKDSLRLGKRASFDSTMRLGKRAPLNAAMRLGKRQQYFDDSMRLGKRGFDDSMRLGKRAFDDSMRLGKRGFDPNLRLGKRVFDDSMRLGKRGFDPNLRLGKRGFDDSMRLGKRDAWVMFDDQDTDSFDGYSNGMLGKRGFDESMRLGKRAIGDNMRLGKRAFSDNMRLGKRGFDESMRLGKRGFDDSMRLGKRGFDDSMRLGKRAYFDEERKRALTQSLRLGKRGAMDNLRLGKRFFSSDAEQDFHSEDAANAVAEVESLESANAGGTHIPPQKRQQYAVDTLRLGKRSQQV